MNALRFVPVAQRTMLARLPPVMASQRTLLLRPKSTLVRQNHKPHQEPNYTSIYAMVLLGGCGIAAILDRMGFSHHDLMPQQNTTISRRDTLLDGVRGTNWK